MDKFVKVTAVPCNQQGNTSHQVPKELLLSVDLIGAIDRDTILLKAGSILNIGGQHYTNIILIEKIKS